MWRNSVLGLIGTLAPGVAWPGACDAVVPWHGPAPAASEAGSTQVSASRIVTRSRFLQDPEEASSSSPAVASGSEEVPVGDWHRHALTLGLGTHHGWAGVAYTFRATDHLDLTGGVGVVGVAASVRVHPARWRPLYLSGGVAPVLPFGLFLATYGPDLTVGLDFGGRAVAFQVGAGVGVAPHPMVTSLVPWPIVDIGLGGNFGKRGGRNR